MIAIDTYSSRPPNEPGKKRFRTKQETQPEEPPPPPDPQMESDESMLGSDRMTQTVVATIDDAARPSGSPASRGNRT
ncbi:hypothetical protein Scep_012417 [Stephania cephalantha]|uniref:Uncharacterized protein n=1 Tax=Stephania cephalantha TaxID=152367 RepID=A0AAP0JF45_9MAGN